MMAAVICRWFLKKLWPLLWLQRLKGEDDFFNACFSQKEAQAVVDKVEAAIGMNTEIGDEAAIVLRRSFIPVSGLGRIYSRLLIRLRRHCF